MQRITRIPYRATLLRISHHRCHHTERRSPARARASAPPTAAATMTSPPESSQAVSAAALAAARELLAERGWEQTTMVAIAERAGVGRQGRDGAGRVRFRLIGQRHARHARAPG